MPEAPVDTLQKPRYFRNGFEIFYFGFCIYILLEFGFHYVSSYFLLYPMTILASLGVVGNIFQALLRVGVVLTLLFIPAGLICNGIFLFTKDIEGISQWWRISKICFYWSIWALTLTLLFLQ
jgi:hypothetical protein